MGTCPGFWQPPHHTPVHCVLISCVCWAGRTRAFPSGLSLPTMFLCSTPAQEQWCRLSRREPGKAPLVPCSHCICQGRGHRPASHPFLASLVPRAHLHPCLGYAPSQPPPSLPPAPLPPTSGKHWDWPWAGRGPPCSERVRTSESPPFDPLNLQSGASSQVPGTWNQPRGRGRRAPGATPWAAEDLGVTTGLRVGRCGWGA